MNIDDKVYIIDNKEFVKYPESKNGCCYGCYFYRYYIILVQYFQILGGIKIL